ncbi:hypothetical protein B0J12DRAFT_603475 [Macrophomina phaseolina]|uniref:Fe2OG dioxygenase domain-containing protein n=1 Tax=Macrophomina phaseolina TaxID=35725 RepID=A0ABQ8G7Y3_9PEZI|nr:hypothetical protein B0J12DRAFT_603475 [Macrophomina phaseolina]
MSPPAGLNESYAIAGVHEVSFDLIKDGNQTEAAKLLEACREDGIFYLNLKHLDGSDSQLLQNSASIYHLAKQLFDLPTEEKMKYDIDLFGSTKVNGYKPVGRNFGGLRGNKDGFESYAIAKDTILALTPAAARHLHPPPITTHLPLLRSLAHTLATITTTLLTTLSASPRLARVANAFHRHHRTLTRPSPDLLRLLKYHAQPSHERGAPNAPHTDLGTLTVLFAASAGLQRQRPDTGAWEWVPPRDGCAVVNVGDALEALSMGVLRSCVHRVVPAGEQGPGMRERWSWAWLQRPEGGTVMRGLLVEGEGEGITVEEWLERKFQALRRVERRVGEAWVVTGQRKAVG